LSVTWDRLVVFFRYSGFLLLNIYCNLLLISTTQAILIIHKAAEQRTCMVRPYAGVIWYFEPHGKLNPVSYGILNPMVNWTQGQFTINIKRYKVCQWLGTGWWFSSGTPVSSTNKTDSHDITEVLLKVVLNTITLLHFSAQKVDYCSGFTCSSYWN
jgi:hypothetical protein